MSKSARNALLSFIVLIILWSIAVMGSGINTALFPTPTMVLDAFRELFTVGLKGSTSNATLINHIGVSMLRFIIGYIIAAITGVILGLLLGIFPKVFEFINPIVQLIRPVAPVAWLPFIVLLFGIGDVPAIVIIFIAGFFPILLSTVSAVNHLDPTYTKVAKNFGISKMRSLVKIIFPAAFPQIMNSLHLALGTSWIFLVSGEMVGAQSGLGFLVMDAKNCIRSDALLATIITIGIIGLILDAAMGALEKGVSHKFGL
ncbi:binding-protein-dependent transport system inner membrane component [Lachnospiraceae bacterium TWA4]|nr:binding-protein-dependent transport system inner membrane component [Lachnospiraceae bacterium TWA4]